MEEGHGSSRSSLFVKEEKKDRVEHERRYGIRWEAEGVGDEMLNNFIKRVQPKLRKR